MKRNRTYEKAPPTRESRLLFIFCEGEKREVDYFRYFNRQASQVVVLFHLPADGNNTPDGLFRNAIKKLEGDEDTEPEYPLRPDDEVWFVIDTDCWGEKINDLRAAAITKGWQVAQSNPCFELWLYYHFFPAPPAEEVANWKTHLNALIPGGFDSRKHPEKLPNAVRHAEANHSEAEDGQPQPGSTQVFQLGKAILKIIATSG